MIAAALGALLVLVGVTSPFEFVWRSDQLQLRSVDDVSLFNYRADFEPCDHDRFAGMPKGRASGVQIGDAVNQNEFCAEANLDVRPQRAAVIFISCRIHSLRENGFLAIGEYQSGTRVFVQSGRPGRPIAHNHQVGLSVRPGTI